MANETVKILSDLDHPITKDRMLKSYSWDKKGIERNVIEYFAIPISETFGELFSKLFDKTDLKKYIINDDHIIRSVSPIYMISTKDKANYNKGSFISVVTSRTYTKGKIVSVSLAMSLDVYEEIKKIVLQ